MPTGVYKSKARRVYQKGHIPWNKGKKFPQFCGTNAHNWTGGRKVDKGYVLIYKPSHPSVHQRIRKYVFEHRLVMEKYLGRYLTSEEFVHHINGVKADNRIENLRLFIRGKNWHNKNCPKCGFHFLIR